MTDAYSYPENIDFEGAKRSTAGANVFSVSVMVGTVGFLLASAKQGGVSGVGGFFIGFSLSFVPLTVAIMVEAMFGGNTKGKGYAQSDATTVAHEYESEPAQQQSALRHIEEAFIGKVQNYSTELGGFTFFEPNPPYSSADPLGTDARAINPRYEGGDPRPGRIFAYRGEEYRERGRTSRLTCPRCAAVLKVAVEPEAGGDPDRTSPFNKGELP